MSPYIAVLVGGFLIALVLRNRSNRSTGRGQSRSGEGFSRLVLIIVFLIGFTLFGLGLIQLTHSVLELKIADFTLEIQF